MGKAKNSRKQNGPKNEGDAFYLRFPQYYSLALEKSLVINIFKLYNVT